jgi:precorrin-2 dehydrogenase/sirohydrochlorin ferrochelatase
MSTLYPPFLNLQGRVCVVVGGNEMAEWNKRALLDADATVCVVAPAMTEQVATRSQAGKLQWLACVYETGDVRDAFLVVSVADPETNARVFEEAEGLKTFCSAMDDINHCNCYASAIVRCGSLHIAISTAGKNPALVQRLQGIRRTVRQAICSLGQEPGRTGEPFVSWQGTRRRDPTQNATRARA